MGIDRDRDSTRGLTGAARRLLRRLSFVALLGACLPAGHSLADSVAPPSSTNRIQFLPSCYVDGYLIYFANQRSKFDEKRFVGEGGAFMEFDVLAVGDTSMFWDFRLNSRMGKSATSDLPFAIQEVNYALVPLIERPVDDWLWRFGFDHSCYHLVRKTNETPWYAESDAVPLNDVYYNRLFLDIGSQSARPAVWRRQNQEAARGQIRPSRLAWTVEGGYYLRDFFNVISKDSLYKGNDWIWDAGAQIKCALFRHQLAVLAATSETQLLGDKDRDIYWREKVGLELTFLRGGFGSRLFVNANPLDEHPRDSREGIVEMGATFFF